MGLHEAEPAIYNHVCEIGGKKRRVGFHASSRALSRRTRVGFADEFVACSKNFPI